MIVSPAEPADRVPVVLPVVSVKFVVSELIHVTEVVMSCWVLVPGNVASALKVTVVLWVGVVDDADKIIDVGVPSVTVTVVVAAVTVPEAALMVAVQIPVTLLTGVTSPEGLMPAQDVALSELQLTFPVRSLVEPSLKVPVADICSVWAVVIVCA